MDLNSKPCGSCSYKNLENGWCRFFDKRLRVVSGKCMRLSVCTQKPKKSR